MKEFMWVESDNERVEIGIAEVSCPDVIEDLPLLAFAVLEPEREREVENHAARCEWCARQVALYATITEKLRTAFRAPPQPPRLLTAEDIERAYEREMEQEAAMKTSPAATASPTRMTYDIATQSGEDHSVIVAKALIHAYGHIRQAPGTVSAYQRAHDDMMIYLDWPMSEWQRMQLHFVLGMRYTATEEYARALEALDTALDLALRLTDLRTFAECAYLCGAIYDTLALGTLALEHYDMALDAMNLLDEPAEGTRGGPDDATFIMTVQLAHQEASMRHLHTQAIPQESLPPDFPHGSLTWLTHRRQPAE